MARLTSKVYGPKPIKASDNGKEADVADTDQLVNDILNKIGFTGIGIKNSKIGKISSILIDDTIESIVREYPGTPAGAIAEIISFSLDRANFGSKISKLIDMMFEVQQEAFKEVSGGKIMDKWVRQQEQEQMEDSQEPYSGQEDAEADMNIDNSETEQPQEQAEDEKPVDIEPEKPIQAEQEGTATVAPESVGTQKHADVTEDDEDEDEVVYTQFVSQDFEEEPVELEEDDEENSTTEERTRQQ